MYCPRLDHFVRFNPDGTLSRCGHMVQAPKFQSLEHMDASDWLASVKQQFAEDQFPAECQRCQDTEQITGFSIRLNTVEFDQKQTQSDYLVVGGVLDNVCNSACQTCNQQLSTKIGSLTSKDYIRIDNANQFWQLPLHRVVHLDINGGEPSASKNYRDILANLPNSVTSIRINTNGSKVIHEVKALLDHGVKVTVTVSLDGIGPIHDYVRWPILFSDVEKTIRVYRDMGVDLNTWTTVSALNIGNLKKIFEYVADHKLQHSWALLETPSVLSVKFSNHFTRSANVPDELKHIVAQGADNTVELQFWTAAQDQLRGIKLWDYFRESI